MQGFEPETDRAFAYIWCGLLLSPRVAGWLAGSARRA